MYDAISDFLKTLSADSPALWAMLVLGSIATLSLGLYALWEVVLLILFPDPSGSRKNRYFALITRKRLRERHPNSGEDRS